MAGNNEHGNETTGFKLNNPFNIQSLLFDSHFQLNRNNYPLNDMIPR